MIPENLQKVKCDSDCLLNLFRSPSANFIQYKRKNQYDKLCKEKKVCCKSTLLLSKSFSIWILHVYHFITQLKYITDYGLTQIFLVPYHYQANTKMVFYICFLSIKIYRRRQRGGIFGNFPAWLERTTSRKWSSQRKQTTFDLLANIFNKDFKYFKYPQQIFCFQGLEFYCEVVGGQLNLSSIEFHDGGGLTMLLCTDFYFHSLRCRFAVIQSFHIETTLKHR